MGGGPHNEDPIPVDGNPHPRPQEQHDHPNQDNLFFGPLPQHDNNEQQVNVQNDQNEEAEDAEEQVWDH